MAPFRNPFNRRPPALNGLGSDENTPPQGNGPIKSPEGRTSLGSRASSALSIKQNKEPNEFKLSVVNDSGVYLPPSPPEKQSFWSRTPTSTTTSSHRSFLSDNEPFSISRESFESYRRSFDISARSPIVHADSYFGRQSLDSRSPRTPRSALAGKFEKPEEKPVDEEVFEEVGLNDDVKPKKRGLFSRFGDMTESNTNEETSRPASSHRGFHLPGRKRGQSGQGAELGAMPRQPPKEETGP